MMYVDSRPSSTPLVKIFSLSKNFTPGPRSTVRRLSCTPIAFLQSWVPTMTTINRKQEFLQSSNLKLQSLLTETQVRRHGDLHWNLFCGTETLKVNRSRYFTPFIVGSFVTTFRNCFLIPFSGPCNIYESFFHIHQFQKDVRILSNFLVLRSGSEVSSRLRP